MGELNNVCKQKKMNKIGQKEERSGVFLILFGAIVLVFGDFFAI